jgi:ubiquinone/menaquinone biosynthesis C-methylase UbiE
MTGENMSFHKKLIHLVLIVFILNGGTSCRRSGPVSEAERFDRIARKLFKEVYPGLARQITEDFGITKGLCLDLGCGPGYLSIELARRTDLRMIGVDIDSEAVAIARRNVRLAALQDRIAIERGDVHNLRFSDNQADLIVSRGSFLFWKDKVKAFKEVDRVLKRGGVAFIGGGMSRYVTQEKHAAIRRELDKMGIQRPKVTPFEMEETLAMAGVMHYTIHGDQSTDSACQCGMWIEIRKPAGK